MKSKTTDVKIDFVTRVLLAVAALCPLFFLLCCGGLFTAEGRLPSSLDALMAAVAPVGYLAAGVLGVLASLWAVIRSKKRSVFYVGVGLLVLNILIVPPVLYVATRIVQSI